jgi:hypothetical protein
MAIFMLASGGIAGMALTVPEMRAEMRNAREMRGMRAMVRRAEAYTWGAALGV